jgi:hypothetical protein
MNIIEAKGREVAGALAWIIHDLSGEKRKDALKG